MEVFRNIFILIVGVVGVAVFLYLSDVAIEWVCRKIGNE
jgi:preprotein translocase subunit SecE